MSPVQILELGFEEQDEIPPFVKQVKRNVINTQAGTSEVLLPSGILTFKF
jgi:hypothetical protein